MPNRGSVQNPPVERFQTKTVTLLKRRRAGRINTIKKKLERSRQIRLRTKTACSSIHTVAYYISNSRKSSLDRNRLKINSTKNSVQIVTQDPKLGIIVRIKGNDGLSPECREAFRLLRLDMPNNAVFVKINQHMINVLNAIGPYCIWGYPSLRTIKDLISKRGYTEMKGKRLSINNKNIEDNLGTKGILCIEDVIHELTSLGPAFVDVLGFLSPFRLMPLDRSKEKNVNFYKYGRKISREDWSIGSRTENINELITKML